MSETGGPTPFAFAVLYRWRVREELVPQFLEGWRRMTLALRQERGGGGSCLHRAPDGTWVAYARWPSAEARARAFENGPVDPEASRLMREAILESLPELCLEVTDDLLRA